MNERERPIETVLRGIERQLGELRERMRGREEELRADRERSWIVAAKRERSPGRATGDGEIRDRLLEEAAKEYQAVFIVHSGEAAKALEKFAGEGARLVSLALEDGSRRNDAGITRSSLAFE
ncbi:hypothetical protein Rxycam_01386 [Rubrobacter xylanophilus DSM 9941]|uniref:hypothetical protein n=1 Tax=Rubrobacter xylanophilus TaxID=49319 RepID=UPI001C63E12A|nr:hypothetical protein [Rubrobacter xylanophilus]QYJ15562.1 hypothetical protein Rxycam_01386 [Rubrobacter xylanophilus DSM 9941]